MDPFGAFDVDDYDFPSSLNGEVVSDGKVALGDVIQFLMENNLHRTLDMLSSEYEHTRFFGANKIVYEEIPQNFICYQKDIVQDVFGANLLTVLFQPTDAPLDKVICYCVKGNLHFFYEDGSVLAAVPNPMKAPILAMSVHPTRSDIFVVGLMDGSHGVWKIGDDCSITVLKTFQDHTKYVVKSVWSHDGSFFATASRDGSVGVYNFDMDNETAEQSKLLQIGTCIESIEITMDDHYIIAVSREDNYLHYLHTKKNEELVYNMNTYGDDHISFDILDIKLSNNGKYLLMLTDKHSAILMKVGTSVRIQTYSGFSNGEYSLPKCVFSPDDHYIYISSEDNSIYVFSVNEGKLVSKLDGHTSTIRDLAINKNNVLVSCSYDKTVRVWSEISD